MTRPAANDRRVFLIGGGWSDEQAPAMLEGFADAVRARAGERTPRVVLVVMGDDVEARSYHDKFVRLLGLVGLEHVVVERVLEGGVCTAEVLEDLDGIFVGGGPTPAYHAALAPRFELIRSLVAGGLPYAGFSAGAAVAAARAVVGGWRLEGRVVCPEESNEDLDELCVLDGMGLIEGAVDVHAAAWGNLSRLVAVVDSGLATSGLAIDECTTLAVGSDEVSGAGAVWRVVRRGESTTVTRQLE